MNCVVKRRTWRMLQSEASWVWRSFSHSGESDRKLLLRNLSQKSTVKTIGRVYGTGGACPATKGKKRRVKGPTNHLAELLPCTWENPVKGFLVTCIIECRCLQQICYTLSSRFCCHLQSNKHETCPDGYSVTMCNIQTVIFESCCIFYFFLHPPTFKKIRFALPSLKP